MYTFTDGTFGDPHFGITSPASSENSTYGEKKTDFGAQPVSPPTAKMEREIERMLSEESPHDDGSVFALFDLIGGFFIFFLMYLKVTRSIIAEEE